MAPEYQASGMSRSTFRELELFDDEEVLHDKTPSWAAFPRLLLISIASLVLLVGAVGIVYIWWIRRNTQYVVTTERIIHIGGSGGRRTREYRIEDVQYIESDQSFVGSVLGTGSVTVTGPGTVSALGGWAGGISNVVTLGGVADHHDVANTIRELKRRSHRPAAAATTQQTEPAPN